MDAQERLLAQLVRSGRVAEVHAQVEALVLGDGRLRVLARTVVVGRLARLVLKGLNADSRVGHATERGVCPGFTVLYR